MEDVPKIPGSTLQNLPCSPSFPRTSTEPQGQDPKMEVRDINPITELENRCLRGGEDQKEEKTRNRKMGLCACMWGHACMYMPVAHRGGVNRDQGGRWTPLRENHCQRQMARQTHREKGREALTGSRQHNGSTWFLADRNPWSVVSVLFDLAK